MVKLRQVAAQVVAEMLTWPDIKYVHVDFEQDWPDHPGDHRFVLSAKTTWDKKFGGQMGEAAVRSMRLPASYALSLLRQVYAGTMLNTDVIRR